MNVYEYSAADDSRITVWIYEYFQMEKMLMNTATKVVVVREFVEYIVPLTAQRWDKIWCDTVYVLTLH